MDTKVLKMIFMPCDLASGWRFLTPFFIAAVYGAAAIKVVSFTTVFVMGIGWVQTIEVIAIGLSVFAGVTLWPILWQIRKMPSRRLLQNLLEQSRSSVLQLEEEKNKLSQQVSDNSQELRTKDQHFGLILNTFNISTFHHDTNHRCVWAHNTSFPAPNLIGKLDKEIFDPVTSKVLTNLKDAALVEQVNQQSEIIIAHADRERHYLVQTAPRFNGKGETIGTISVSCDITERAEWQAHLVEMLREVNHRSRNLLTIIGSICSQTALTVSDIFEYRCKLTGRIMSLAKSIELITENEWRGSSLHEVFDLQTQHLPKSVLSKIIARGPTIKVNHKAAQNLGLAFHELLSNAHEYGALSQSDGRVEVSWQTIRRSGEDVFAVCWTESGGPMTSPPQTHGFGLRALKDILAAELGGQAEFEWKSDGLLFIMSLPSSIIEISD